MSEITRWRFPLRDGGTIQGFNDSGIATFKGAELYNNLAREICQNSLDAKADGKDHVIVKFSLKTLPKNKFNAIYEFDDIISACEDYVGSGDAKFDTFIKGAKALLANENIDSLVISDYNTTGLTGAKDFSNMKSVWTALTSSTGITNKTRGGSGGSYGIGKSAPFACSGLRTVFYNTYADDGVKAFQGVSRLVTHKNAEGRDTQGDGYYQNANTFEPIFEETACPIRDEFVRNEYGTDVIILGFKNDGDWQDIMSRAIIKNFFYAIYKGTLIVEIEDSVIDKKSLPELIKKYAEEESEDLNMGSDISLIKEFYETVTSPDNQIYKTTIIEENDLVLYLRKDDTYTKTIAEMRAIGMIVRTRRKPILSRFSAVVIAEGEKLNKLLKSIEPPKHDEWDAGILEDQKEQKKADKIKKEIVRWTNETIINDCKPEYQEYIDPDGMSQFLPLELDDLGEAGASKTTESPDGETFVREMKKKSIKMRSVMSPSINTIGTSNGGEGHNRSKGGTKHNPGGIKDHEGTEKVHAAKEKGKNSVENSPKVMYQRSYPISPDCSIYKTIIVLEEDNDKVRISAKAIGDDGRSESLEITEYTIKKVKQTTKGGIIGPISMKANEKYEIFMKLSIKERLLINIIVN